MLKKFDAYQLALKLYEECRNLSPPRAVKDQLDRASLSIVLNLGEGPETVLRHCTWILPRNAGDARDPKS
jgi:hypothetical protein